jgi:hypothetical protein
VFAVLAHRQSPSVNPAALRLCLQVPGKATNISGRATGVHADAFNEYWHLTTIIVTINFDGK